MLAFFVLPSQLLVTLVWEYIDFSYSQYATPPSPFHKLLFSLGMPTFIINRPLPSVYNRYAVISSGKYCLTQVGDVIMVMISSIKYELVISDFTFELINKAGNTCEGGRFESSENLSDNEPKKDVEGGQVKNSYFIV